jgi:hypothetical protein
MSQSQFANGVQHASKKELVGVAFGADVSKDKAIAALEALESTIPPETMNSTDGDFGDETPGEIMKKLIAKLKDKLAQGGSLAAEDRKDMHEAAQGISASLSKQAASAG